MVSDGWEIYWDDSLVSCIISNHWDVYLKLIKYCMSTVIEKLNNDLKKKKKRAP